MGSFNLNDYDTVDSRISQFWAAHTNGAIRTCLVHDDGDRAVIRAEVYRDREYVSPCAVGYAEERRNQGNVNKTSHIENCETSAIGRALANLGYATKKRPSREEMQKAERYDEKPEPPEFDWAAYAKDLFTQKEWEAFKKANPGRAVELLSRAWDNDVSTKDELDVFLASIGEKVTA